MQEDKSEGRPLKFESVEELQKKIDEYFESCDSGTQKIFYKGRFYEVPDPRPYTVTGLALFLDTSRETLMDYENGIPEKLSPEEKKKFSDTIKKAKEKIHNYAEESLWQPKIATGV